MFSKNLGCSFLFGIRVPNDRDLYLLFLFFSSVKPRKTHERIRLSLRGLSAVIFNNSYAHIYSRVHSLPAPRFTDVKSVAKQGKATFPVGEILIGF